MVLNYIDYPKLFNIKYNVKFLLFGLILLGLSACSSSVRFTSGSTLGKSDRKYASKSETKAKQKKNINFGSIERGKSAETAEEDHIDYKGEIENGYASYYGDQFDGKQTASGEIYDQTRLTAAHKTLPFGSVVKVTNMKNGKNVFVEITDRGPFIDGRIIDLSTAAAQKIEMIKDGVVPVELLVVK